MKLVSLKQRQKNQQMNYEWHNVYILSHKHTHTSLLPRTLCKQK